MNPSYWFALIGLSVAWGFACAIAGVVYVVVLRSEGVAPGWFQWLEDWRTIGGWRMWIASPIGGCEKCTSGQLALWSCSMVLPWSLQPASIGFHLLAGSSAVLFAMALNAAVRWLMNRM